MGRRDVLSILGLMVLLCAPSLAHAQTQSEPSYRLALKGYDPVAYFTVGVPTVGKPELEVVFDGARYRFASKENMALFKSDPDKYAPQFAGACANGLSMGFKVEADPTTWRIIDGKLFMFAGKDARDEMDADPYGTISRANEHWKTLRNEPF